MNLEWEGATTNSAKITIKKAKCGCEVMYATPFVINACCDEHFELINKTINNSFTAKHMRRYGIEI